MREGARHRKGTLLPIRWRSLYPHYTIGESHLSPVDGLVADDGSGHFPYALGERMRMARWHRGIAITLLAAAVGAVVTHQRESGPILRTVLSNTYPTAIAVDSQSGRAFVVGFGSDNRGRYLWMLDADSGHVLPLRANSGYPAGLAVDEQLTRVFVAGWGNTGHVLDARSGTPLYTAPMGNVPSGAGFRLRELIVSERTRRLFVANYYGGASAEQPDSTVSVLDTANGRLVRTVRVGRGLIALAVDEKGEHVFGINRLDATVSMLDARNGIVLNTTLVGSYPLAVAIDDRTARVFVTGNAFPIGGIGGRLGHVDMLDAHTGALLSTVTVGVLPSALAVDAQTGRVFVTNSGSNTVSTLDARSGRVVRTVAVGRDPVAVAVDIHRRRIFVTSLNSSMPLMPEYNLLGNGSVSVLDARSGAIMHTIPVGVNPTTLQVDERTARAFVVNSGGQIPVAGRWDWVPEWLRRWMPFLSQPRPRTRVVPGSVSVLDTSR